MLPVYAWAVLGCAVHGYAPAALLRRPSTVLFASSSSGHADDGARRVAFEVLQAAVQKRSVPTSSIFDRVASESALGERDRAFARNLVATTERRLGEIDALIDARCKTRPRGATLTALRLGLVQLLFLDKVPAHAAVHSSVELAKAHEPRSAGLVNAVLRSVERERRRDADAATGTTMTTTTTTTTTAEAATRNVAAWIARGRRA